MEEISPIGVFDSGYGGLTILKEIEKKVPGYDFIYLGDNARTPYGPRSYETIYKYTLQAVEWLFSKNCNLVILACNTASAKALRTIQQNDLLRIAPEKRVLGVIRPVTERVSVYSQSKHIGVLGTTGTVMSNSYVIEIEKFSPEITVIQEACPMWVPLVENGEAENDGADYFVNKHLENILDRDKFIDTMVLACTHYPLLINKIKKYVPSHIKIISQGEIVAESLVDYLHRHNEIDVKCSKGGHRQFYTTDSSEIFDRQASVFYDKNIKSERIKLS